MKDDEKSASQKYFLETNTQFYRLHGSQRQQESINQCTNDAVCYTSLFVLKEFHSIVTLNLINYYNLLSLLGSVKEATKEFLTEYSYGGRIKNLIQVISDELKALSSLEETKSMLELFIRQSEAKFMHGIHHIIDHTGCPVARMKISDMELSDFLEDFKCPDVCCLIRFFQKRCDKLECLVNVDITSLKGIRSDRKKEFENLVKDYSNILDDPSVLSGARIKNRVADTVIAFENPSTACLLTYDVIFEILCPALGKDFKLLKHPPRLMKKTKSPIKAS